MALNSLPLGYCTNVHPAQTFAELLGGLDRYTVPVMRRVGRPMAAGLWLAHPVVNEVLAAPDGTARLAAELNARGLTVYTLNAFPYGDFHAARVKENVYLPDWTSSERLSYTERCATVLAELLPEGGEGSISTLPIGFKGFDRAPGFLQAVERLTDCAQTLARIAAESGRTIRVAIEPEPFCLLETTEETIEFFRLLWGVASARGAEDAVREHIGVCYDVCHQAVEFEAPAACVASLDRAGVRVNKVQVSCAIELNAPAENAEGRAALWRFIEPRYLHQVFARLRDGRTIGAVDLTTEFLDAPGPEFTAAETWRVHFHVPVDAEHFGSLGTTRSALRPALAAIAALNYAPHVEVETYTWAVLPGEGAQDLVTGLANEINATQRLIDEISTR
ncbi:Xylose isomerase-like TIM barrel [Gemmata sp. SH-PL17]|uniref:metabolite traffic protein EboE n=1 Tax=Gemmata sp. SH-PL17 TaxID=1630693 RepID=UPI00078BB436|nr:metabolite traffic protein EboE [Gemmata sp. SH-PL17]AMV27776.1 Xylose isomerase-like TIM barrel [Gemmata sp. SH-PL17]